MIETDKDEVKVQHQSEYQMENEIENKQIRVKVHHKLTFIASQPHITFIVPSTECRLTAACLWGLRLPYNVWVIRRFKRNIK